MVLELGVFEVLDQLQTVHSGRAPAVVFQQSNGLRSAVFGWQTIVSLRKSLATMVSAAVRMVRNQEIVPWLDSKRRACSRLGYNYLHSLDKESQVEDCITAVEEEEGQNLMVYMSG